MSGNRLIEAHGGALVNLIVSAERAARVRVDSLAWPSWDLNLRQVSDLELLLNGGFSPLTGFMCRQDYESVCSTMTLADETIWPVPVTLDVPEQIASQVEPGQPLALRDPEGFMLAVLHVEEVWQPDLVAEGEAVFGTDAAGQRRSALLMDRTHPWYVGGQLEGLRLPRHHDFTDLRRTPAQLRLHFATQGWERVIAYQISTPLHQATYEVLMHASEKYDAALLINPAVGMTGPGDLEHYTRGRCYRAILPRFPESAAVFSMVSLVAHDNGPRETLLRAIVSRNQGCTHFLFRGEPSGPDEESQELVHRHRDELGITLISYPGVDFREELSTFPEVAAELARSFPLRHEQGFAIFFTGLSGAGKSTVASVLVSLFLERRERPVTLLDGDLVRKYLSSELGFSKEDRDTNISRIGFVASEITKNGGIAVCAPIAPYDAARREVRELVSKRAGFVLVHVSTPLEECEKRDRKGHYAKARAGIIKGFTGISDPYEEPTDAEIVVDTTDLTPEEAARLVMEHLVVEGYIL